MRMNIGGARNPPQGNNDLFFNGQIVLHVHVWPARAENCGTGRVNRFDDEIISTMLLYYETVRLDKAGMPSGRRKVNNFGPRWSWQRSWISGRLNADISPDIHARGPKLVDFATLGLTVFSWRIKSRPVKGMFPGEPARAIWESRVVFALRKSQGG